MNKRIARKVLSLKECARRGRLWRMGYGPEHGPWPLERRAEAYLDRRQSCPYKRSYRAVRRLRALQDAGTPDAELAVAVVTEWEFLRPYVAKLLRGRGRLRGRPLEGETVEEGRAVGETEVAECGPLGPETVASAIATLDYFSDRWCVSRLGRMDAFVDAVRGLA